MPINIWMCPKESLTNKYNEILSKSLEKEGMNVHNFSMKDFLKVKKGDIVHFHWLHPFYQNRIKLIMYFKIVMFLSILFFLKLRKAKVVWTVHNLYPHKYRWKRLEKKVRKIIMSRCDKLIVAAYSIKASIINEFGISSDKIDVVLHGHYKGVYPTKHKDFRGEYNINPKKIIFLFVGAIKEYKGVLELLDNFVKIDNSNGHLIIAGKTYDNMEQLIEPYIGHKNITFDLRFIPDEELSDLITSSDYVVLPYKNITTSGTAILAVSLKRKIICPSSPFMKEYFDSHTAIMYDSKRTNELMNILKNCLYQHNQVIPENSYQNFLHKLSWTNIAKQIKSIYYSI